MTLEDTLAELAAEAGNVLADAAGDYTCNSRVFAAHPSSGVIELKLGAEIAEAARRTPDAGSSARGDEWVRFAPKEWSDHARDRLGAWFRVAWRLAGG